MDINTKKMFFPERHIGLLYNNEQEAIDILVAFIIENIEKNIRCLYITGDTDTKQIIAELSRLIDYDKYIKNNQLLILKKEESYSATGHFDPDRMIEMLIEETNNSISDGFRGLAVTGEVSWALKYNDGFEKIMEYEWKLNDLVFLKHPVSSICRYNLKKFTDEMIINIIQVHPYILWDKKMHKNPFYIPAEGYKSNQIKKFQVDSLLKNLSEITNEKTYFQDELKLNEERLRRSQAIANAGAWELEIESDLIWACDQAFKIFGLKTETNLISVKDIEKMIHIDDWEMVHDALIDFLEERIKYDMEYRILQLDSGQIRHVRSIAEKQYDENGKFTKVLGVILDITEKKKLEEEKLFFQEQVWNQQKLESIGTLASGVAHEINNPINGILNYGQIILDSSEPNSKINKFAAEIIYESNRVSEIVKNLLDFSRQSGNQHSYARIEDIIDKTLSLVEAVFRHDNITINSDVDSDISNIKCRSQQIQQVLMNLITNARDSLNEKYPGYHEKKKINLTCHEIVKENRKWISITIEDFGIGIPEHIIHRIFDPFYTTKAKNIGTGLGLSISYGIVKEHHGEITVDSKEGLYTKFSLILPCDNGWDIE